MIKQIEIVVSYSGKISKPKYENVEVFFSVKEIIEQASVGDQYLEVKMTDEERNARMLQIKTDLQSMFELDYKRIHDEQEPKEEPTEDKKESLPRIKLSDECIKVREECYGLLMDKAEHSDFLKIKNDLWEIMKSLCFTKDDLNKIETWQLTKEALCKQVSPK